MFGTLLARFVFPAIVAVFAVPKAHAVDWSAKGAVTETGVLDDNIEVEPDSAGEVYGSTTAVTLDVTARTQRSTLNVNGGFNLNRFTGPGATSELNSLDQDVRGDLEINGPSSSFGLSTSFSRQNATFSEFEDTGFNSGTTDRLSYSVGANASVEINRTNRLSAAVDYSAVDFTTTVQGLTPFQNFVLSSSWAHNLSNDTDFELQGNLSFFREDDLENSKSDSLSVTGRVTTDITSYFKVFGSGGVNLIRSARTPLAGSRETTTSAGLLFDVGFEYQVGVTDFSFSVSQSVAPSASDGLRQSRSLNAGASHQINTVSSISLSGSLVVAESSSGTSTGRTRTFARIGPTYSLQLSKYWQFGLGYEYRYQDGDVGVGSSNKIFGTLKRDIVLLP